MARPRSAGRVNCGQWPVGRSMYVTSRIFGNSRTGSSPSSIHSRSWALLNSGQMTVRARRNVFALTHEFTRVPRSGETVYGFVAGLYPTDYPTLPEAGE
jgi:hypothetical protein